MNQNPITLIQLYSAFVSKKRNSKEGKIIIHSMYDPEGKKAVTLEPILISYHALHHIPVEWFTVEACTDLENAYAIHAVVDLPPAAVAGLQIHPNDPEKTP